MSNQTEQDVIPTTAQKYSRPIYKPCVYITKYEKSEQVECPSVNEIWGMLELHVLVQPRFGQTGCVGRQAGVNMCQNVSHDLYATHQGSAIEILFVWVPSASRVEVVMYSREVTHIRSNPQSSSSTGSHEYSYRLNSPTCARYHYLSQFPSSNIMLHFALPIHRLFQLSVFIFYPTAHQATIQCITLLYSSTNLCIHPYQLGLSQ